MWGMAYYENTLTSVRFFDAREDLDMIPGLHLKKIGEDGHEIKPRVTLPVTDDKIKAGRAALAPNASAASAAKDATKSKDEE